MLPRMFFFSCVCVLNINFYVLLFQPTLMRVDKPTTLENIGRQNGVKNRIVSMKLIPATAMLPAAN